MRLVLALALAAAIVPSLAAGQGKPNQVKGQGQLVGGTAQFGTVYSLRNGLNFEILAARYSLEPYNCYGALVPQTDQKLFIIDIAVKNHEASDLFWSTEGAFTLVDDKGNLYKDSGGLLLESRGNKDASINLRPGQGLGQPELKDPLHIAWLIPNEARIDKIMVNSGRLNTNEEVVRYLLNAPPTSPTKEKNFAAKLPEYVRDLADSWGATPLPLGIAAPGTFYPSYGFDLRFDSISMPEDGKLDGNPASEGKKFVVVAVTAKSPLQSSRSFFDLYGGDTPLFALHDSDGETYKPLGYRKLKQDEAAEHEFAFNDSYSFRIFFEIPKEAKLKDFVLASGSGHKYLVALPSN